LIERRRIAMLTPLPPARTGVAHYASMLLPALSKRADVTAFDSLEGYDADAFDVAIYQLGNNPFHEFAYREAMRRPGVTVLHDFVLHHLIVEMTLARGDAEGAEAYVAALEANHGPAGGAWAEGRAAGLHSEMGNFLFPSSIEVASRSSAVIVHNRWAADALRAHGVATPIHVVPHPYETPDTPADRDGMRRRLGFSPSDRVIGLFGFLTSAKRAEVILEAFRIARKRHRDLRLLIVGEAAPNIDAAAIAGDGVTVTGFVEDADFSAYYAAADRLVNLRYPSAGETSGTLIRALVAGKPVAVSDYAQFAELPDGIVIKIPFGESEAEELAEFFVRELPDGSALQRRWLAENNDIEKTVAGYLEASGAPPTSAAPLTRIAAGVGGAPLFPVLNIVSVKRDRSLLTITLKNNGAFTLRGRDYGQPAYRALFKLYDEGTQVQDNWVALPGDLHPGHSVEVTIPVAGKATHLRLYHALESIPFVESEPAETVDVR
jgi:glycosyltransferase involved in cell wall biosynthesis